MKFTGKKTLAVVLGLALTGSILLGGCANVRPLDPQPPTLGVSEVVDPTAAKDVKVVYSYGQAQLSSNNIVLAVGQKLILEPAQGLTKSTRFTSSGEFFFGDVMQQDTAAPSGKVIFVAKKAGKGKLQIIPNNTEVDRAVDLWVTVK